MTAVESSRPILPEAAPASPFYSEEHEAFRRTVRRFVEREIAPYVDQWGINAVKSTLDLLAWRVGRGEKPVAEICMLKNLATSTMEYCANEAMQIFGGAGYLRGAKVERIYRETKVMAIGGGSIEIMKDLAARQMGL